MKTRKFKEFYWIDAAESRPRVGMPAFSLIDPSVGDAAAGSRHITSRDAPTSPIHQGETMSTILTDARNAGVYNRGAAGGEPGAARYQVEMVGKRLAL